MTRDQLKLCKIIIRRKALGTILREANLDDPCDLEDKFYPGLLDFSDYEVNDDTVVTLTNELLEEYEKQRDEIFYHRWPFIISIIALIISVFAFLATIGSDSVLWTIILKLLSK